jgi:hypothetical protein
MRPERELAPEDVVGIGDDEYCAVTDELSRVARILLGVS